MEPVVDPVVPRLEKEGRRRRGRLMFRHRRIPVRMMVPNFFTLLGLSAGLTSIRMSIEGRYELALAAIVFAALLDGIDGRVARLLKASSRFGAELDSLADFVNFGVAPAILIFTWGLGDTKSIGWICVMIFALAAGLRLARFNVMIDEEKPKWQSNYFTGMPTPAAAIVVLLPVYLAHIGLDLRDARWMKNIILGYTLVIAFLMISNIPTFSGKLMGERISREWVLPIFMVAVLYVAMLVTYPNETLAGTTVGYLAMIPVGWRRYQLRLADDARIAAEAEAALASEAKPTPEPASTAVEPPSETPPTQPGSKPRLVELKPGDPRA
ncbi:MAG: CDP-diacylglycerol--serine O-phosphatidyltransferase [Hyphomicrobiaceae bacterium]